jgi:hypothetical protein
VVESSWAITHHRYTENAEVTQRNLKLEAHRSVEAIVVGFHLML